MRSIVPTATAVLPARAYFACAWADGWLAVTQEGRVTVLDRALTVVAELDAGHALDDVSLGGALVGAGAGELAAWRTATARVAWRVPGRFLACKHTADGRDLWTAATDQRTVTLAVRDPDTGATRRALEIADPFGGSAVTLGAHPAGRAMVAWFAAGQDGQAAFLVRDDGERLVATEIPPRDRLPPVFTPAGDTYLSCGETTLECRLWPSGEIVDELEWADEDEEPDDGAGSEVHYVPGGHATWASENGRLYLVDLAAMAVIEEIAIAGHPLRTIEDLYPELAGERTPATDFQYAVPGPDGLVLTVHADTELAVTRLADWGPPGDR